VLASEQAQLDLTAVSIIEGKSQMRLDNYVPNSSIHLPSILTGLERTNFSWNPMFGSATLGFAQAGCDLIVSTYQMCLLLALDEYASPSGKITYKKLLDVSFIDFHFLLALDP
jgi:hypothetical protein